MNILKPIKYSKYMQKGSDGRWTNVIQTVSHLKNLVIAYEEIHALPGLLTPAIDHETISGISQQRLIEISQSLQDGSFRFKPMRRVWI
uniref:AtpA intron1 ORF n=1 Tax=Picea glauca TaxID=3330 RepID=A0A124GNR9_PICGL|nr:atpA intron1 ORF [Picea glauca]